MAAELCVGKVQIMYMTDLAWYVSSMFGLLVLNSAAAA